MSKEQCIFAHAKSGRNIEWPNYGDVIVCKLKEGLCCKYEDPGFGEPNSHECVGSAIHVDSYDPFGPGGSFYSDSRAKTCFLYARDEKELSEKINLLKGLEAKVEVGGK